MGFTMCQPLTIFYLLSLCLCGSLASVSASQCPFSSGVAGRRSLKQSGAESTLQLGFYDSSCPSLDQIVADKVTWYTGQNARTPAKLLRLFFHDCIAGGCEASILLTTSSEGPTERDAPISATLEQFEVIDDIKTAVEEQCPGVVSCADILALAAVHSVRMAGGPTFSIDLGRRDGWHSYAATATEFAPLSTFKVDDLLTNFANVGLDQTDLVALSGAHTIGEIHCTNFLNRYQGSSSPFPDEVFGTEMYTFCSNNGDDPNFTRLNRKVFMEALTPNFFDAQYFVALMQGRGLITSDQDLFNDRRTRPLVESFTDRDSFFTAFESSMHKLGRLGVLTGSDGTIRRQCWASP